MRKKKVLIFIDWYLPGFKAGGPIRSIANLISGLGNEFDFFVVTRNTDYLSAEPYKNVNADRWNKLPDGSSVYYFSAEKLNAGNICSLIDNMEFDVAYLNGMYSRFFTLIPLRHLRKRNKKIVLSARGMLSKGSLGVKPVKKKLFLSVSKLTGLFRGVVFHATTEEEKKDILAVFGNKTRVVKAGNLPAGNGPQSPVPINKQSGSLRLVSIARIAPEKNLSFALQVISGVKGQVEFDIYGPVYDEGYWAECCKLIEKLPSTILVTYKGSLESENVAAVLGNNHLLFMPSTGENFGHIILQSLAAGRPVIISDRTPWRDLAKKNIGWDLDLKSPQLFIDVIGNCCDMDQRRFDAMVESAAHFAAEYSADPRLLAENIALFQQ